MVPIPIGEMDEEGERKRFRLRSITALVWLLNGGFTGAVGAIRVVAYFFGPFILEYDTDLLFPFTLVVASILSLWIGIWILTFTERLGKKEISLVILYFIALGFTFFIDLITTLMSPRPFSTTALLVGAAFLVPLNVLSMVYFTATYRYETKDIEKPLYRHPY